MTTASPTTPHPRRALRAIRAVALGCLAAAVALAVVGVQLLFAGDWLEDHSTRYGALGVLLSAVLLSIAAVVLAIIGATRRPREVASWVVVGVVILPVPLGLLVSRLLGA